jgi:hypothetical protein
MTTKQTTDLCKTARDLEIQHNPENAYLEHLAMTPLSNFQMFVQWNKLELQIATLTAKHEDLELIAVYQQEQDLVFMALNDETQREMMDLRRLRELENRLGMAHKQFCPFHEERYQMEWVGDLTYTQDSTGKTTGAYRVIACPACGNHEMEGVRA